MVWLLVDLNDKLHGQLKLEALKNKIPLSKLVPAILSEWVREAAKEKQPQKRRRRK
jgi:hypothetical protein